MQGKRSSNQLFERMQNGGIAATARNRRFAVKLSTPIYNLKRKARQLARVQAIPLHAALDRIAAEEGYSG
jgi:carbamoylphosphate synthase small subunit